MMIMVLAKNIIVDKGLVRLWLLLLVTSVASLVDVAESAACREYAIINLIGLSCLVVLKTTVMSGIYAICRRNIWLKSIAIAIIAVFMALSLLNGGCWLLYDFGISRKLFTLIVETNPDEVREFLPELEDKLIWLLGRWRFWGGIGVFAAMWVLLPRVSGRTLSVIAWSLSLMGLIYLTIVCLSKDGGRASYSIFLKSYKCVASYVSNHRRSKELLAKKLPLPFTETLHSSFCAQRVVVVIGESVSRDHLSIYGYPLPTTPRLDSVGAGVFRLDDAVASSTSTAQNMPRLVTFMTDEPDGREWYEFPSLLTIFHHLGYRTYWLSNQEKTGNWSDLSGILSVDADVVEYVGALDSEDYSQTRYDDALLPEWRKASCAEDSLKLTFIHMMGSHFQYYNRFPEGRRVFTEDDVVKTASGKRFESKSGLKKARIIADYDNSILYTDSILDIVLRDMRADSRPGILIYVSDHGENVYDDGDYRGRDPKYVGVPFIVYLNDAYRCENPDIVRDLETARDVAFSTSELPQILMHLTGTRYAMYDSVRDPLSAAFKTRKRWVDGDVYYQDKGIIER